MFKRKTIQSSVRAGALAIATAMAGMGTAGLSTSASAVGIAQDGLGEAMIFPYYTARNGFASFFNITNTSEDTVLIKVRWNEGENSRDARDFNVILSPHDMWTVATVADANSDNTRFITADSSCTAPVLGVFSTTASGAVTRGDVFTNFAYSGAHDDTGNQGLDRTREGYFTVFEMGKINQAAVTAASVGTPYNNPVVAANAQLIIDSAEHSNVRGNAGIPGADNTTAGRPTNCGIIDDMFANDIAAVRAAVTEPTNVLKGRAVLIELSSGVAHGYDPVVLFDFFTPNAVELAPGVYAIGTDGTSAQDLINTASTDQPNLNSANPHRASFLDASGALVNQVNGSLAGVLSPTAGTGGIDPLDKRGVDAVTALLSRASIINDYNVNTNSQTDWVITFPTKAFYVDKDVANTGSGFFKVQNAVAPATPEPFAEHFYDRTVVAGVPVDGPDAGESCITVTPAMWDREEFQAANVASNFSPQQIGASNEICKEANILSFGSSNIFDSKLRTALFENNPSGLPGNNGWARLSFAVNNLAAATPAFTGIPVVGMRLEARSNPRFPGKNFGFASKHAYERN